MNPFDMMRRLEDPSGGGELLLYLLRGRAAYRVFQALSDMYQTDEDLDELAADENMITALNSVAIIFAHIRKELAALDANMDLNTYLQTVQTRYPDVLDAVQAVSDELGVSSHDFLSVLLNA